MTSQDAVLPNRHQRPKHSGTSQNPGSKPTRPVRGRASAPALQLISSRMVPQQQEVGLSSSSTAGARPYPDGCGYKVEQLKSLRLQIMAYQYIQKRSPLPAVLDRQHQMQPHLADGSEHHARAAPNPFANAAEETGCLWPQIHVRAASVMPGPQLTTIERAFLPGLSEESLQMLAPEDPEEEPDEPVRGADAIIRAQMVCIHGLTRLITARLHSQISAKRATCDARLQEARKAARRSGAGLSAAVQAADVPSAEEVKALEAKALSLENCSKSLTRASQLVQQSADTW